MIFKMKHFSTSLAFDIMSPNLWLVLQLLYTMCTDAQYFHLPIQPSSECRGRSDIPTADLHLRWDVSSIYDPNGWPMQQNNISYRASVCGGIANASCNDTRPLISLESVSSNTSSCISGLSHWDNQSSIGYYAIASSNERYPQILGVRVQINDTMDSPVYNCSGGRTTVNFDILCHRNGTSYSISKDPSTCNFTVTIHSELGCTDYEPLSPSIVPYQIGNGASSVCKGRTSVHPLNIEHIEWDLGNLGNADGFEKPDFVFGEGADRIYRLSLCQGMSSSNASRCESERDLCLEIAALNRTCIRPLAAWDESSVVLLYALCMVLCVLFCISSSELMCTGLNVSMYVCSQFE